MNREKKVIDNIDLLSIDLKKSQKIDNTKNISQYEKENNDSNALYLSAEDAIRKREQNTLKRMIRSLFDYNIISKSEEEHLIKRIIMMER